MGDVWFFSPQAFDDFIFAFFAVEMVVKMVALGIFGPKCYLGDTWNRLDLFIVMAGWVINHKAESATLWKSKKSTISVRFLEFDESLNS